jgi:hypothetical protein
LLVFKFFPITSSSEELLKSIKVYEGKCEDETNISCCKTKVLRATFTTNATIPRVKIRP